jgi:hypothetical protein
MRDEAKTAIARIQETMCTTYKTVNGDLVSGMEARITDHDLHILIREINDPQQDRAVRNLLAGFAMARSDPRDCHGDVIQPGQYEAECQACRDTQVDMEILRARVQKMEAALRTVHTGFQTGRLKDHVILLTEKPGPVLEQTTVSAIVKEALE